MQEQKRTTNEIFSARLRELRGKRSQADFANFLGIGQQRTYANYEKGRIPRGEVLEHICAKLGVSADYLLGAKNEKALEIVCDMSQALVTFEESPAVGLTNQEVANALSSMIHDFYQTPPAYQTSAWPRIDELYQEMRRRHEKRVEEGREIRRKQREGIKYK